MNEIHAIILVGGKGTRLQPLTDKRPKPMLPIVDRPFLAHQLSYLKAHGVTGVTFACGFHPEAIEEYFGDGKDFGLKLSYVIEPEPLDTAGAIAFAARTLEPQRLLVLNGDVLTGLDVSKLIAEHEKRGAVATIALTPVDNPSRYGLVRTTGTGAVTAFVEKPPPEECDTNLINAGTYVLEPSVIDMIPAGERCNIEREIFPKLVDHGLYALGFNVYWNDIGTHSSYLQANRDVLAGLVGDGAYAGARWIAEDVSVDPSAEIGAGVVVCTGAKIGAGVKITNSVVLEGVTIEEGAVLDAVLVCSDMTVPAGIEVIGSLDVPAVVAT